MSRRFVLLAGLLLVTITSTVHAEFRAGAAIVDVTPLTFPVLVNGSMTSGKAESVNTPLNARAIVVDDGRERLAIVVVDSCMMSRPFLDEAKALAASRTKIRPDRMLISATHTHSAAASMGCLGTDADPVYVPFLREKLAEAIAAAEKNLEPARIGWGSIDAGEYTATRQWVRRPDRLAEDPFGNFTVRANMHAARNWDDVTGPNGPEDPELSLISLQTRDGRPLAVLANFSMHYFGDKAVSADYFGLFCTGLKERIAVDKPGQPSFVGIMSHGCSGDIWRRDYSLPDGQRGEKVTIDEYAGALIDRAKQAYDQIKYQDNATVAMAETRMTLNYRVPDKQRLEWAQRVVTEMGDRLPKNVREVYAREQLLLHEKQSTEIVVQALRLGDMAIATTPNETYALSGLKLKLQSPMPQTMVIELANGGDGYIPPPEQHLLGGYNTWAARSAGLEVLAEPKIVAAGLHLLEQVSNKPRRQHRSTQGPATMNILANRPAAYWRLDELAGPRAIDSSEHHRDAIFESPVLFFLDGPHHEQFCVRGEANRAVHLAGGRMSARIPKLGDNYTISLWFWNGMPNGSRPVLGWLMSRGEAFDHASRGEHLGLVSVDQGKEQPASNRLQFMSAGANAKPLAGRTTLARCTWHHLVLVREANRVRVYVNGNDQPEIDAAIENSNMPLGESLFFGGRCDGDSTWEGRLDEIAVFDRVLTADERAKLSVKP